MRDRAPRQYRRCGARAENDGPRRSSCWSRRSAFPDPQAEWLAVGAIDVLARARVCANLDEALAGSAFTVACTARPREVAVPMVTAREAAARMVEVARTQPVALVFGNETSGLTTAEVKLCQLLATIPADPEFSSLNVAAAVQVLAYELRIAALGRNDAGRQARASAPRTKRSSASTSTSSAACSSPVFSIPSTRRS